MVVRSKPPVLSKRCKILLVNPPLPHNKRLKRIFPMGLLYVSSYLMKQYGNRVDVRIYNPQVTNTGLKETVRTVLAADWDIMGIGYWTNQFQFATRLSAGVRAAKPHGLIVHGGLHATLKPESALLSADRVILHEGEKTLASLVASYLAGEPDADVPGTARLDGDEVRTIAPVGFIRDLDELPFPAWDLLDLTHYTTPMHVLGGRRLPLIGSRGCPYNCSFCVSPRFWKRRVRWRSPENIVDEMQHVQRRFGINQFHFWDDNLLLNRKHAAGVAEEILRRNLDVKWLGLSRASHVVRQAEIIPLLARAGLIGLEIGIESANTDAYRLAEKDETLENLVKACEIQKKNGMFPMYTYMSYLPGDTIRGAYEQARFMDKLLSGMSRYKYFHHLPFDVYIGQCCTPHVGTRMHEEVEQYGRPMWEDEEEFHHNATCFLPHSLLQDRPVRRTAVLTVDDRVFCVVVAYVAIADYLSYGNPWEKMRNVAAFNQLLDKFWQECNGEATVSEIAERIWAEGSTKLGLNDVLRFVAAASITLAQVGALDSQDASGSEPMARKEVPYRFKSVYRSLLQMSRLYGKATGRTLLQMTRHHSYDA